MKYPFFASFLILCAVFYHNRKKTDRNEAKIMQDFFDRENAANNTRRQPLDNLNYIKIPFETLPMELEKTDSVILECLSDLTRLKDESIVNFTGMTNTDLKLEYGPANLPFLQQCDFNFTSLVTILHKWARRLYELGHSKEALVILEYAISIKADVSGIYYLAADIYLADNTPEKIQELITSADSLNSAMKPSIVSTLNSKLVN